MKGTTSQASDFIVPLCMDGLSGRMLHVPAPKGKTREILFVYGHHSSLERWWGLIQDLNQYGAVTMPDLPGFGGMESLYRRGQEPTIDNLADYLAAFIKLRYRRKKVTIAGLSFGFVVATRMLQRYPELVKKVDLLVSVVGFAHQDDFVFSPTRHKMYYAMSKFGSFKLPSLFYRHVLLSTLVIKTIYRHTHNAKNKFSKTSRDERKLLIDFEVKLWHANDVRTHCFTLAQFLKLDNCHKQVDLPVWHIAVRADNYFDNHIVEQHMRVIFKDFHMTFSETDNHAPSVIADAVESAPLIPRKIRAQLKK
jgi:pimeloyl-ACP methyl ester carboxylesterase